MRAFFNFAITTTIVSMLVTVAWGVQWEQDLPSSGDNKTPRQTRSDVFTALDANKDGVLTEAEATTESRAQFFRQLRQAADQDGDGRVTRAEYLSVRRLSLTGNPVEQEQNPTAAAFLFVLDIDRDGALSAAEIAIASERILTLDADGDGGVSAGELQTAGQLAVEALAHEDRAAREIAVLFAEFDKDHDGQISLAEAPDQMRKAFNHLDIDSDGAISLEEFSHALRSANEDSVGQVDDSQDRG
ncbi:MAG: EF-hand domain-containing protein [Pirellulales bacterium]|nr:EF-hand domain-containing protein [Pirellulales bacterium]